MYNPEYAFISDLIRLRHYRPGRSNSFHKKVPEVATEAQTSFLLAIKQQTLGRSRVALKLLKHAAELDPSNAVILTALGEALEKEWDDIKGKNIHSRQDLVSALSVKKPNSLKSSVYAENVVAAENLYARALIENPQYQKATKNQRRTLPVVEQLDQQRLKSIDSKVARFYLVPESNPGLRLVKIEHYFQHIYHSNAIEGNTLSLAQTRAVLETRIAVGGKSLQEQNEVLGLDAAFRFLNTTLLKGSSTPIELSDLLELHRRVLSFVDLTEAGRFRETQVFIADHTPPAAEMIPQLMRELMAWVNSEEAAELHPIEQAALAHWKLVYIHPFYDGNGRTARLLMNLILMRVGFPPAIIRKEDRHLYYETLKIANIGDVRPFIRFITDCAERTLDDYLVAAYGTSAVDIRTQGPSEISLPAPTSLSPITSAIQFTPPSNFLLAPEKSRWSETMLEVKQSVEVLRRQQRLFRVNADVNYCGMILGQPQCFIEFYRHLFCDHSPEVAAFLVESGFHMSGTDDRKFMALVYRVCRDILNMKPVVSLSQFFTNGFSGKKIQMATEIIKALAVLEKELHRKPVRGRPVRPKTPFARSGEAATDPATATARLSDSQITAPSLSLKTQRQPQSPPAISTSTRLSGGRLETTAGRQTLKLDSKALLRPSQDSSAISVFTDEETGDTNTADISQQGDSLRSPVIHELTETAPKRPFSDRPSREYATNIENNRYAIYGDRPLQAAADTPEARSSWMKDTLDTITKQVEFLVKRVALIESRITTVERKYISLPPQEQQLQKPDGWDQCKLTELEEKIQQQQNGFPTAPWYRANYFESVPVRDGGFAPTPKLPQDVCPVDTAAVRNPSRSLDNSPYANNSRTKCSVAGDAVDFLLPPKHINPTRGPSISPANSSSRDLETYPWLSTHEGDCFLPSAERTQPTGHAIYNNTVLRKSYLRHRISDDPSPMPSYCDPINSEKRCPSYNTNNSGDCHNKPTSTSPNARRATFDGRASKVPSNRPGGPSAESPTASDQDNGPSTQPPDMKTQVGQANSAKPPLPTLTKGLHRLEKENRSPQPETQTVGLQSTPSENGLQEQFKRICLMLSETQNLLRRPSASPGKTTPLDGTAQVQHVRPLSAKI
ncbi:hypothetical protein AAHC03_0782 [Spirometra sp. Aus1]